MPEGLIDDFSFASVAIFPHGIKNGIFQGRPFQTRLFLEKILQTLSLVFLLEFAIFQYGQAKLVLFFRYHVGGAIGRVLVGDAIGRIAERVRCITACHSDCHWSILDGAAWYSTETRRHRRSYHTRCASKKHQPRISKNSKSRPVPNT